MTAPYSSQAEQALRDPIRHVAVARFVDSFGSTPLDLINGRVEFTASAHPYASASVVIAIPETQAEIERIDPRLRPQVEIDAGYVYTSGLRDVHPLVRLDLHDVIISRPENIMTLRLVGREMRLMDTTTTDAGFSWTSAANGVDAIRDVVRSKDANPNAPFISNVPAFSFVTGADIRALSRFEETWAAIDDIADRGGVWLYHDGMDTWRLDPLPSVAGKTSHFLATGEKGQIRTVESQRTRTTFYNSVSVHYRWYDGTQREANGFAEVLTGDFDVFKVGRVHHKETREIQGSTAEAQAVARRLLLRGITGGRTLSIGSAAAAYWLRPGMTIQTQLVTGPAERHLVDSVIFDLPEGTMHLNTRQPENVDITIGT